MECNSPSTDIQLEEELGNFGAPTDVKLPYFQTTDGVNLIEKLDWCADAQQRPGSLMPSTSGNVSRLQRDLEPRLDKQQLKNGTFVSIVLKFEL